MTMFHTLTVGLPDTTLYLRLIGFTIGDVKDHPMRWLLLKVPGQLSIVTEPPDTSSQTVHQYGVPGVFSMVVIGVYSPGFSVTWALGLLIRFVIIIGHHPPDGRSYARGIVSPVKKPGSPPPHGFIVSVGQFHNRIGDIHRLTIRIKLDANAAISRRMEPIHQIGGILSNLLAADDSHTVTVVYLVNAEWAIVLRRIRPEEASEHQVHVSWNRKVEPIPAVIATDVQLLGAGVI